MTSNSVAELLRNSTALVLESISKPFRIHSVYCYNLSKVDEKESLNYHVEKVRDGRNFSIRFVEIMQKNKPTMVFEFSLQNISGINTSLTYTPKFPNIKLPSSNNEKKKYLTSSTFFQFYEAETIAGRSAYWMKLDSSAQFDHEDIPLLMFSDYNFFAEDADLITEHSVWVHENGFDPKDWVLLEFGKKSENMKSSVEGKIWSQGGRLLLSFIQERRSTNASKM